MGQQRGVRAAPSGSPDELEPVRSAVRLKKFSEAAGKLQALATAGNAEAQYQLGCFFLNGLNGPRDAAQARHWFEQAAGQRHARAAYSLANLLATSDPPDPAAAQQWLARAREFGFSGAGGAAATQATAPSTSLLPATQLTTPQARREGLWLAAEQGDIASLTVLADRAEVAATDEFGRGALARAAQSGSAAAWHCC